MSQQYPYGGQGTHGPWGAGINQSQGIGYSGAPPGVEFPMYYGYPGAGCPGRFGGYGRMGGGYPEPPYGCSGGYPGYAGWGSPYGYYPGLGNPYMWPYGYNPYDHYGQHHHGGHHHGHHHGGHHHHGYHHGGHHHGYHRDGHSQYGNPNPHRETPGESSDSSWYRAKAEEDESS